MCYLCPTCRCSLGPDAEARGLGNYHVINLARMALGEVHVPRLLATPDANPHSERPGLAVCSA